ncbi:MAG TPA: DinB family protein [Candidatus Dormibacteraeota bacterium]|nr:DinB family protein [Candidatus Dormibacteraeota bacterium]
MKQKLLRAIEEGRQRETELEAFVVDAPADPDGRWNAKDHLAHLSWWRARSAKTMDAVRTGGEPPPPVADDDDVQNAVIYAEIKHRSAADVKADAGETWAALERAVAASSEEDLAKPAPGRTSTQVWEAVPGTVGHAGTHVWSWYLDVGDKERAMAVAQWASDLEAGFFTKPEQLAVSRYNLACVYARLGKASEAIPLLRESFEARPDLVGWARKDRDLDPIREELAPILM